MATENSLFTDRLHAAKYYAENGKRRFFVFGLDQGDLREWQVRESHKWLGISGGSGLITSYPDRALAEKEAARLNALDAAALGEK